MARSLAARGTCSASGTSRAARAASWGPSLQNQGLESSLHGRFQQSGALIQTPNHRALIVKDPQLMGTAT